MKQDKTYEIDQSLNYIVVAIPKKNSYNTSFTFQYHTDGVAFPWYEILYNDFVVKSPNGDQMLIIAYVMGAILVCVLVCCLYCCARSCCCKEREMGKVGNYADVKELTASGYYRNKIREVNVTATGLNEMELHSLSSESDNRDDRTNAGDPHIKRETKA